MSNFEGGGELRGTGRKIPEDTDYIDAVRQSGFEQKETKERKGKHRIGCERSAPWSACTFRYRLGAEGSGRRRPLCQSAIGGPFISQISIVEGTPKS